METNVTVPDFGLDRLELAASNIQIRSQHDYANAGEVLVLAATIAKKLKQGDTSTNWPGWDDIVATARAGYDRMLNFKKAHLERCEKIIDLYSKAMEKWRLEEELKIAALRQSTEQMALEMRKELEKQARQLNRAGMIEQAEKALQQRDMIATTPQIPDPDFSLPGVTQAEEYEIEITDLKAFLKAVVDGEIPLRGKVFGKEYPIVDVRMSVVTNAVKSMGAAFNWPGISVRKGIDYRPRAQAI